MRMKILPFQTGGVLDLPGQIGGRCISNWLLKSRGAAVEAAPRSPRQLLRLQPRHVCVL